MKIFFFFINVFSVTFDHFNASLPNKSTNVYMLCMYVYIFIYITYPKLLNDSVLQFPQKYEASQLFSTFDGNMKCFLSSKSAYCILKYIKLENNHFKLKILYTILVFYCIFHQINAAIVSIRDFFQEHKKIVIIQFDW